MQIHTYHHLFNGLAVWSMDDVPCFDEMLLSWSANRPLSGNITISVSLKTDSWSDWHLYAVWGSSGQHGGNAKDNHTRIFQDTIDILEGHTASGFRVHLEAHDGADLSNIRAIHACTTLWGM